MTMRRNVTDDIIVVRTIVDVPFGIAVVPGRTAKNYEPNNVVIIYYKFIYNFYNFIKFKSL